MIEIKDEIRSMDAGGWYWVSKEVIQEHTREIGYLAICVYHLLASMADEKQSCYPSQNYIADKLGCSRSSVSRAIKKLTKYRLLKVTIGANNHRIYQLLRINSCTNANKMSHRCNRDVAPVHTNNTKLTISNNNIVRVSLKRPLSERQWNTKESILASDIAEVLGDRSNLKRYLSYACKYPEMILREFLSQVKQIPASRIKKSRAALFAYLVKHYEQNTS